MLKEGKEVLREEIKNNYQRMFVKNLDDISCDEIKIEVSATHGCKAARIFEIRVY